jgi:NAD dependent epimerase/dehydratase family enzyme
VMSWMPWMAMAAMEETVTAVMAVAEIESPSNLRRSGPVRRAQIAQQLGRRLP